MNILQIGALEQRANVNLGLQPRSGRVWCGRAGSWADPGARAAAHFAEAIGVDPAPPADPRVVSLLRGLASAGIDAVLVESDQLDAGRLSPDAPGKTPLTGASSATDAGPMTRALLLATALLTAAACSGSSGGGWSSACPTCPSSRWSWPMPWRAGRRNRPISIRRRFGNPWMRSWERFRRPIETNGAARARHTPSTRSKSRSPSRGLAH